MGRQCLNVPDEPLMEQAARVADLVVVGSGAAGLTGALVAAIGGARVILLEKTELIGGTTAISGGGAWIPCNSHMGEVGVTDTREEALDYLRACTGGKGEDAHLLSIVDEGARMIEFLEREAGLKFQAWPAIGGAIDYRPWLTGAKLGGRNLEPLGFSMQQLGAWAPRVRKDLRLRSQNNLIAYYAERKHLLPPSSFSMPAEDPSLDVFWRGTALVAWLLKACLERGVEVLTQTAAVRVLKESGRVAGIAAHHQGKDITICANHVLMASGGYTNNEELKRLWLNRPLDYTCDIEANQGDGHLMGAAIGAQMAGLGDAWWLPHMPLGFDGGLANLAGTREDRILPHTLMVNSSGKRFMNEATNYYDCGEYFGNKTGAAARNFPAWFLFDQQGVERYMLLAFKIPPGPTPEWLRKAESVEHLARSIGVDGVQLERTIARFNGFAKAGVDEDFSRGENPWDRNWGDPSNTPNSCLGTVAKAPFYAIPVFAGANSTRGGLRVDARGRVVSALNGEPIPGFYAAGNCSNASAQGVYCGPGATIGPAMTFAYLIGLDVAAQVAAGII